MRLGRASRPSCSTPSAMAPEDTTSTRRAGSPVVSATISSAIESSTARSMPPDFEVSTPVPILTTTVRALASVLLSAGELYYKGYVSTPRTPEGSSTPSARRRWAALGIVIAGAIVGGGALPGPPSPSPRSRRPWPFRSSLPICTAR